MSYFLTKGNLNKQIELWQKKYQIFVVERNGSDFFWKEINNSNITFNPVISMIPPKKFFLPDSETLFNFFDNAISPQNALKPFILLELSSIDLKALALLDKVMIDDPYYQSRRQKAILIGTGSQLVEEKYDLFFQNFEDRWLVHIGSPKGHQIIFPKLYQQNSDSNQPNSSKIIDPLFSNPERLVKAIKASYQDKIWDDLAKICLGCGICTYVCPLCYCFYLEDRIDLNNKKCPKSCQLCSGTRVRKWDSCMLPHFSEVAGPRLRGSDSRSNHNFRAKLRDRIYNWYHHKFVRFPMEYGKVGCVNCGRCIKYCPAKINYRKVLEEVLIKYR